MKSSVRYSIDKSQESFEKTDHWKARYEKMRQHAAITEQLTDASIDCVVAMDSQGKIIYWNKICSRISGLSFNSVEGSVFADIYPATNNNVLLKEAFRQVRAGHKAFVPAEKDTWLPGYFEIHLVPIKDENDCVDGIMLIAHDVAHRVKAEQELIMLNQALEEKYTELKRANAEMATFTRLTSNDLKDPLRKIYSSLEKMVMEEGDKLSVKGKGTIRKVQSSVQRIGLLADSLISFSELQYIQPELVSLNNIVQESIAQLSRQIKEQSAIIEVAALPEIKGDRKQLGMLFYHLLSNAIKFHEEGDKPIVRISCFKEIIEKQTGSIIEAQAYWRIDVQDNGIGIIPEDRERIFGLFEKGTHAEKYAGAGIGLALARKIIENHNGFIDFHNAAGKGVVFSCRLPGR